MIAPMTMDALADVARALGFELRRAAHAVPVGVDFDRAKEQTHSAFLIGWRDLRSSVLGAVRAIETQDMPEMSGRSRCGAIAEASQAQEEHVPMTLKKDEEAENPMTDEQAATEPKMTALQYRDRAWSEVEFDFPWNSDVDLVETAHRNGWWRIQTLGDSDGLSVDVYARGEDAGLEKKDVSWDGPLYLATYNFSETWEYIILPRVQDLIDFLAHVSSTMLAAILPHDITRILHDLCEKTPSRMEEHKRERERLAKLKQDRATRQADGSME